MGWDTAEEHFASNLYYDAGFQRQAAKLLPGEYYYTNEDMVLVTVLGSCVSACIRDPVSGYVGMNHFMLPEPGYGLLSQSTQSMRYGNHAMNILLEQMVKAGARQERFEAKVFGGGSVVDGFDQSNVGERNAAFVLEYLAQQGIPVRAQDLNGNYPRKVYFFPRDGKVFVRKIHELKNDTLAQRELAYARRLKSR